MYDVLEDLPFLFTAHQRSEQQRSVYLRQISTQRRLVACSQVTPHGNFFVVDVALSVHRGCHNNVVIGQPERWVCLWGAIILMHVSEYEVQRSFLSCWHFDYLFQSKVV